MGGLLFNTIVTVSKYSTWDKISKQQTKVQYSSVYLYEVIYLFLNSHVVLEFLPEPVQNLYFNIFSHN